MGLGFWAKARAARRREGSRVKRGNRANHLARTIVLGVLVAGGL